VTDVAAADTVIAMEIAVVAMAVVVTTIAAALATMTTIDAAMAAGVTVTTAIALETLIVTRVVDAMTGMEAVVIAAVTEAVTVGVAAVAITIALMIVPALLLLLLETNHVSLTQVAGETIPAATIVTEVGRSITCRRVIERCHLNLELYDEAVDTFSWHSL
jgi:hypothetical protein